MTATVPRSHLEGLCAGHFPGDPIVPGAYVAGLLADLAATTLARSGAASRLQEVERCTFLAPLRPADDVVLVASPPEPLADGVAVTAEVRVGGRCVARGRFRFA
jgi:3-hydroxymyristoyl/3-hydroxydecanoyl-(acyl carrier protein) dehydratase